MVLFDMDILMLYNLYCYDIYSAKIETLIHIK